MSEMIWLHEDALRADHPVFASAQPGTAAFYVWDDDYLRQMDYGFKRLLFIYETLLELPVTIIRGNHLDILPRLATQHGNRILVPKTLNPLLRQTITCLGADFDVRVAADTAFVTLPREPDLQRFFRYWKLARKPALSKGGVVHGSGS